MLVIHRLHFCRISVVHFCEMVSRSTKYFHWFASSLRLYAADSCHSSKGHQRGCNKGLPKSLTHLRHHLVFWGE